jgi:FdhD protein
VTVLDNTTQRRVTVYDHRGSAMTNSVRSVIVEGAFVIGVNGSSDYTIMRTPGNDRELAVGFLFSEGIIDKIADITMLMECPETPNSIAVKTPCTSAAPVYRNLVLSSSCGLCGRADLDSLLVSLNRVTEGITIPNTLLHDIPKQVSQAQGLFKDTGATHAAALFGENGEIFAVREDVGRHNAMDKVIGSALLSGIQTSKMGVFLSGRASLELTVKAARAGISVMVSVSAPTDAAITMADKLGIALVGFARESGFTIYSHPERIVFTETDCKNPYISSLIATDALSY